MKLRSEVLKLIQSWLGKNEKDGSYKEIIDIYNSYTPLPRGLKMDYKWSWCAATWSAVAIKLGYTDIMPVEMSCGELIKKASQMGIWQENDGYIPRPGDAILYDWQDTGKGDNVGWPDHIGIVEYINTTSGYMTVIEGNYDDKVKKRTVSINGKFIRGFITPDYTPEAIAFPTLSGGKDVTTVAREAISGVWGNMPARKIAMEKAGYNYEEVQAEINRILNCNANWQTAPEPTSKKVHTTCYAKERYLPLAGTYEAKTDLYCRNDAGTNKKALCCMPKGTKVENYGYYTYHKGVRWLLVQFELNGVEYVGFCSGAPEYLKKKA